MPTNFTCGDNDLDEFVREDALEQTNQQLSETTLFYLPEGDSAQLVAYVTLLSDTIDVKRWRKEEPPPKGLEEVPYLKWPAVLIGRLGVSKDRQRRGFGHEVFVYVLGMTSEVAIGVRFITVDAYESARTFYEGLGFKRTPGGRLREDGTLSMFYDTVASGELADVDENGSAAANVGGTSEAT